MKISHLLFSFLLLAAFSFSLTAEASCWLDPNGGVDANGQPCNYAINYIPMVDLPGVTVSNGTTSFASYASALYVEYILVAARLAVILLVLAGAKYMMTDVVSGKGQAVEDIKGSLLGLLIIIAAFVILNTINPNLNKISIVGIIPNTSVNGGGLGGFLTWTGTAPSITPDDCQAGQTFYACGTGLVGCAPAGTSGAICGIPPDLSLPPGAQPNLINCDDPDPVSGLYGCVSASNLCGSQGGTPTPNYTNGQVSCTYPPPATAGTGNGSGTNSNSNGGVGTNQIAP